MISSSRFPIRVFSFVMTLSVVIMAYLAWQTWAYYQSVHHSEIRSLRLQEARGNILYLDEVLTMSARMAAATGDPQWEERYRRHEPELDRFIKDAKELSGEIEGKGSTAIVDDANVRLIEMENQAFDRVRQGKALEAWDLLQGADYGRLKEIYLGGLTEFTKFLEAQVEVNAEGRRKHTYAMLTLTFIILLLGACSWFVLLRVLSQWQRTLSGSNRKLAEQAEELTRLSRANQTSADDLVRYNTDGIVVLDDQARILMMNPAAEALMGFFLQDVVGKDFGFSITDEKATEIQMVRPLGGTMFGEMKISRFVWQGRPASVAIIRDITERKTLQSQIFQAQKMDAVGKLAGGIAHDFNNLLTVINGYSVVLLEREDDVVGSVRESLEEILKSGQRASELTKQLLAFSRKQILTLRITDLDKLIRGAEKMLRRLIGENIELIVKTREGIGTVNVDPSQIEQVIMNLTVNARDAMPLSGGQLLIETANVDLDDEYAKNHSYVIAGEHVMIAVTDTGSGMTPEVKAHLFEPFFTTKGLGKGTGLGLATCYGIVKQNSGHIEVYSEVGHGTVFKIYFPRVDGTPEVSIGPVANTLLVGTETIFVVEDEDGVRNFLSTCLKKKGYQVFLAKDGESALQQIQELPKNTVHLLLTDVVMPKMNGRELFEKLKQSHPHLKVLFASGYTEEIVMRHEIEGGTNFLQKPFTLAGLLQKVRQVLDT